MRAQGESPSQEKIITFITEKFTGLSLVNSWGEIGFFYNPEGLLKRGIYFCTIKEKDSANDKASGLSRSNIFRLNFGISKPTFLLLFSGLPKRPSKSCIIDGEYDFTDINKLLPHPIYGWMAWVSILNPSQQSWENVIELLGESYTLAMKKYKYRVLKR